MSIFIEIKNEVQAANTEKENLLPNNETGEGTSPKNADEPADKLNIGIAPNLPEFRGEDPNNWGQVISKLIDATSGIRGLDRSQICDHTSPQIIASLHYTCINPQQGCRIPYITCIILLTIPGEITTFSRCERYYQNTVFDIRYDFSLDLL